MPTSVLRQTVHTSLARTLLNEVLTRSVKYYFSYGKIDAWPDADTVPDALDTLEYEMQARKDTVFMKEVSPNDAALVTGRINWVSGSVYDDYDAYSPNNVAFSGATSLQDANFYVVTDEFNVYKCLSNNNSSVSLVKPTGTSASPFQTTDNYIWKYMFSIPTFLRNKFLSTSQMPVVVALQNAYYSNGKIEKFTILSKGSGYYPNEQLVGTVSSAANETNFRIITGYGTSFLTDLAPGDYVVIDNEVRVVSSIESDTQFTIRSDNPLLRINTATTITKLNTYIEITSGDGYKPQNPYIITGVQILDGGSNYGQGENDVSVIFSEPSQIPNARQAQGEAIVNSSGVIIGVNIIDAGYGYEIPPRIRFIRNDSSSGSTASAIVNTIKSKAYISPVIDETTGEIINVRVDDPGIGYTYANVEVRRIKVANIPGVVNADASISIDVNSGNIDSQQATVEAAAINGGIHAIKMTNQGSGYTSALVEVLGDGAGCTAEAIIENGRIVRINVTNPGKDYTSAQVIITSPLPPVIEASARAIISPPGGHGKNAIDELFARTILFYNRLDVSPILGINIDVNFSQLCLYKQPKQFGSDLLFNGFIGSTCYKFTLDVINRPSLENIEIGSVLTVYPNVESNKGVRFKLIGKSSESVLMQSIDNNDEEVRNGYVMRFSSVSTGVINYPISVVQKPDVEKLQGEVIYIDNRKPFKALNDQPVSLSSRFRL